MSIMLDCDCQLATNCVIIYFLFQLATYLLLISLFNNLFILVKDNTELSPETVHHRAPCTHTHTLHTIDNLV